MEADFTGGAFTFDHNGDRQAKFYRCNNCGDLLAVGCFIDDLFRGAISSSLFGKNYLLGEPIHIQPWLLNSKERLERWDKLWGTLNGIE